MFNKMLIFFDTEFSGLIDQPKFISIGLISENGREFYAELSDTYHDDEISDFTRVHVIPHLIGGEFIFNQSELKISLKAFIESFDCEITLASDNIDWDWPFILELLSDWPINLSNDYLMINLNYVKDADLFFDTVKQAYDRGLKEHHALDDARANRLGWLVSEKSGLK